MFRPLNIQEQLPPSFYDEVSALIAKFDNSWWEMLKEYSCIKMLIEIYCRYIGKRRSNSHSLLLRHYPEQCGFSYLDDRSPPLFKKHCFRCCDYFDMCGKQSNYANTSTVLFGDLELDGKAQDVLMRNNFIDWKVGTALIPHHGADSDDLLWLDEQLRNYSNYAIMVVSYGNGNRYGHPKFLYDGTIAKLNNPVAFANDEKSYKYFIEVHE
jgi:hypothetical protein